MPVEKAANSPAAGLRVLSINVYMMGHITYQDTLEAVFRDHFPATRFQSFHLVERVRRNPVLRMLVRISRIRFPMCSGTDRDFVRLRFECGLSLAACLIVLREVRRARYDIVHLHTQALALLAPLLPVRVKYVVSIDATSALVARDCAARSFRGLGALISLERRAFKRAAHIIAWSERARQSVIDDYGIEPGKVTAIPPGTPFHSNLEAAPIADAPDTKVRLLFVGNDFARKGGPEVVSAFKSGFAGKCELHMVSNGAPDLEAVSSLFIHRGLTPGCPELVELYRSADIFILPTWDDCFGIVFIEAMDAGLPCIGSNVMAVPELVLEGKTGFTVAPGDLDALVEAIGRLVESPALRRAMGRAGKERVREKFDAVTNCGRMLDIFSSSARSAAPPPAAAS
jgi:starch synthase